MSGVFKQSFPPLLPSLTQLLIINIQRQIVIILGYFFLALKLCLGLYLLPGGVFSLDEGVPVPDSL
jgi:hypothetical protein